jgi:hypothetical protein
MRCAGFSFLTPEWQNDIRFPADVGNKLLPTFSNLPSGQAEMRDCYPILSSLTRCPAHAFVS